MRATVDFTDVHVGTAFQFELAGLAVIQAGPIAKWVFLLATLSGFQVLASGANITIVFSIEDEIGTAESAVVMFGFIPDRNVRGDLLYIDQPSQHCSHTSLRLFFA